MEIELPLAAEDTARRNVAVLRGQTQGVMVLAGAGTGWVMIGLSALGPIPITFLPAAFAMPALLLLGALALRRATPSISDVEWSAQVNRVFWIACFGEALGIITILVAAQLLHKEESALPAMAVPIGLHFIPLAIAYRRPIYFVTALTLCLVGIVSVTCIPVSVLHHGINGQRLATGLAGGAVLWATASIMLIQSWIGLKGDFERFRR